MTSASPAPAAPTPAGPTGRAGSRERVAFVVLVLGMLVSLGWTVHGWYDPTNDGAMYLLTTRSLLDGEGYSMLGIPFRIRPPGFTLLLAPLVAWRGLDFHALHLFVSLWGVAGCALLFLWAKARLGWPLAWLVAAAVWLNPGYQLLCNQPMSDVPGTTLLFAGLLLERWAARRPGWRRDAFLGAFLAAAAYVRTIDLLLIPAILGMRLVRRVAGGRDPFAAERARPAGRFLLGAGAMVVAAVLVQLPWSVRNAAVAPAPPADQTLLYSYGTAFWHEDMGDPSSRRLSVAEVLERVPVRGPQALGVLGNRMKERVGGGADGDAAVALALVAAVVVVLLKRRESAELFFLGSLLLISIYFGFAPRLLLPLLMIAYVAAAEVLRDLGRWTLGRLVARERRDGVGSALAALGVVVLIVVDTEPRKGWDAIAAQDERLREICRRFAEEVDDDTVLASYRAWHYGVLLERPVYALEFVVKRHLDSDAGQFEPGPMEAMIDRYGIQAVLLSPLRRSDREILPYFEQVYGARPDPVARVYRVR